MEKAEPRPLMRALIVDDHPLFCDALSMTLKVVAGLQVVETAGSLEEATQRLDRGPTPDLVVLDLNLPDVDGLDGLVRLRLVVPEVPVLVVSSLADPRVMRASLRAGAVGFVPKHSHRDIYRAAFEAVRLGQPFLPDGVAAEDGAASSSEEAVARLGLLTRQQARILQLICEGKLNKQIAYELNIAETTVKAHVTAIMRKLGVLSRTQAVLMAKEASFAALVPEGG
jgi:DNA-binding NarL/FixJ family response regulator